MADKSKKRTRKAITLDTKIKIIKLSEGGVKNSEIGRKLNLPRTTVVSVVASKQKILEELKKATPVHTKVIRKRDNTIADMEKLLNNWIDDQTSQHIPLSQAVIQNKAQSLFDDMKAEKGEAEKDAEFGASRGWFVRFKKRSNLRDIKLQGEVAAFKLYYSSRTFSDCLTELDKELANNQEEVVQKFRKDFPILDRIETIQDTWAWTDDKVSTLQDVWKKLYPELLYNLENPTNETTENIVEISKPIDEVEHFQPLSIKEHQKEKEISKNVSGPESEELTWEKLSEAFRHFETGMSILRKIDPDSKRSSKVNSAILSSYECYKEIYRNKIQSTIQNSDICKRLISTDSSLISCSDTISLCKSPMQKLLAVDKLTDNSAYILPS